MVENETYKKEKGKEEDIEYKMTFMKRNRSEMHNLKNLPVDHRK